MKYEAITGCFPNMRLILKMRGGVLGQNRYTVDKMLEDMSGPEEDHYQEEVCGMYSMLQKS